MDALTLNEANVVDGRIDSLTPELAGGALRGADGTPLALVVGARFDG